MPLADNHEAKRVTSDTVTLLVRTTSRHLQSVDTDTSGYMPNTQPALCGFFNAQRKRI